MKKTAIAIAIASAALLSAESIHAKPIKLHKNQGNTHSFSTVTMSRGRLGAQVISMSDDLRRYFGSSANLGILVNKVQETRQPRRRAFEPVTSS